MDKRLNIKGVDFFYTVEGVGRPVVLMHGWGCTHATLASIERMLVPHFKVYNVDFPGFGNSSEPETVWGIEDYTALIEQFVEQERIENPIMLGHSFGGRVGILYASRHHDVRKLILVDAAGIKPKRSLKYYWKVYSYKAVKHVIWAVCGKEKGDAVLDKYRKKVGSSDYSQASPKMRMIMSRVVNEDLRQCLPSIACPTLLIWGENDTATPIGDAKIMERMIPDAGLVSFPGCSHFSFLDNPVQTAAVLNSFLKEDMLNSNDKK